MEILLLLLFVAILFVLVVTYAQRSVPLAPGARAPSFELSDQLGTVFEIPKAGARTVLAFFPRDNTSRCLGQIEEFTALNSEFERLGCQVFFVAISDENGNKKFADAHRVELPILFDASAAVATAFGSIIDFGLYRFAKRTTFIIDNAGMIAATFVVSEPRGHAKAVLDTLRAQ